MFDAVEPVPVIVEVFDAVDLSELVETRRVSAYTAGGDTVLICASVPWALIHVFQAHFWRERHWPGRRPQLERRRPSF